TSLDMPIRGSKEAPKTFRGKHTEVQRFIDHFELLLNKCRVTDDQEKCEQVLNYCTVDVQNVIQTMEGYEQRKWSKLRKEILKQFDAERALQKYKPADVERYAAKMKSQPCYNLTQWRKYYIKYNAIAGGPLKRKHLSKEDYLAYFWIGIHPNLRQILENRILQTNPYRDDEAQYTMKELNTAAEWYFRRNKYESLMVKAAEFGEELEEDDSGEDSESDTSSSDDSESDYEEYRRKRKLREKKKKLERKKKLAAKRDVPKERQKFQGNEEEVAGMIRKLNAMRLDDPEYAPIYYKVMMADKSGIVKECVKPPLRRVKNPAPGTKITLHLQGQTRTIRLQPIQNNIPLGTSASGGGGGDNCFGCLEAGHRILILVQAAERIAGGNAPRVMFGILDPMMDRQKAVQNFYQNMNKGRESKNCAEYKDARKEVFDGVYPPNREKAKNRVREIVEKKHDNNKETRNQAQPPVTVPTDQPRPAEKSPILEAGKMRVSRKSASMDMVPEVIPIEARRARFDKSNDDEMEDIRNKEKPGKKITGKRIDEKGKENASPEIDDTPAAKSSGRQSELSTTVDRKQVMERILDNPVVLSTREIMVLSKEIRNDFQDLIKVKNVKAVLLGSSQNHPLIANLDWPRTEGILIKIEMETGGKPVCAIIDTGSQLDVVRADIAALSIRRAVDMSHVTNMNDANGGRGQLQGWIRDVEFNCGGARTVTDLWVSQKAPFELLLGRPWQRGNLVSIDEREEGTYLIF
ncbi:hypothetical protein C8R44DRAFT_536235, partial [Mycena epipterygia]